MKTKCKSRTIAMLLTMACAVVNIVLTSCKESEPIKITIINHTRISPEDTVYELPAKNADTIRIKVETTLNWSVSSSDSTWLPAKRVNNEAVITVEDNESENERQGTVQIKIDQTPVKTITVKQEGLQVNLGVSFDGKFAPEANGEEYAKEIAISSNSSWVIEEVPEWLVFSAEEGDGDDTIKVWPTSVNTTSADREALVKVKSGSKDKEIRIVQEHLTFEVSETEITFDFFGAGQGYAQEIDIVCNASWEILGLSEWLEIDTQEGNGGQKVKVWPNNVNSSTSERDVTLTVQSVGIEKCIRIVQTCNVPWSFCPDITLGLERTSDEILAIYGDDGTVLDGNVGYISYNENIMGLVFSLDSNNTCDNVMSQFRSSVSNDQVINHCNSHYETDAMINLALLVYNRPSWRGWAKHNNKGDITAMIIYDTEKKVLTATPFNLNEEKRVKGKNAPKNTEQAVLRAVRKMAEMLNKQKVQ